MEIKIYCGISERIDEIEQALWLQGVRTCPEARWQLLVDVPTGWALWGDAPIKSQETIVLTENPCPEYGLDVLEQRPATLLSERSPLDIVRTLLVLETGGRVRYPKPASLLTSAERSVLRLASTGYPKDAIAKRGRISDTMVEKILHTVCKKLGLQPQQLASYYYGNWQDLEGWEPPRPAATACRPN